MIDEGIKAPDVYVQRNEVYLPDGTASFEYTGTLEENKDSRIFDLKKLCNIVIRENYPAYKQQSAALGVYSPEKNEQIKMAVQSLVAQCGAYEQMILNCDTLEDVWNINFELKDLDMTILNPIGKSPEQIAAEMIEDITATSTALKIKTQQLHNDLWNNPDATPQEVLDALGTQAAQVFSISIAVDGLLSAIDPDFTPLPLPDGVNPVVNEDGTVSLS